MGAREEGRSQISNTVTTEACSCWWRWLPQDEFLCSFFWDCSTWPTPSLWSSLIILVSVILWGWITGLSCFKKLSRVWNNEVLWSWLLIDFDVNYSHFHCATATVCPIHWLETVIVALSSSITPSNWPWNWNGQKYKKKTKMPRIFSSNQSLSMKSS